MEFLRKKYFKTLKGIEEVNIFTCTSWHVLFLSFFKDSGFIYWEFHFLSAVMTLCMESLGTELAAAMKTIKPRRVIRPSQEMANRLRKWRPSAHSATGRVMRGAVLFAGFTGKDIGRKRTSGKTSLWKLLFFLTSWEIAQELFWLTSKMSSIANVLSVLRTWPIATFAWEHGFGQSIRAGHGLETIYPFALQRAFVSLWSALLWVLNLCHSLPGFLRNSLVVKM